MDFAKHIKRQSEWSLRTFGPGRRTGGLIKHIKSELEEIDKKPFDLDEWVDVMILAIDGAWRAGYKPAEIANALDRKCAKNEARTWPDWRTFSEDQPIEHIRAFDDIVDPQFED